ncbi:MAG: lysylphosphatidylglycerol synthase transmembrane domain-containing protein [Planctomycetota bacterium]
MAKPFRKALILAVKIAVAAALLGWVLSRVNWYDVVVTADGDERAVAAARTTEEGLAVTYPDGGEAVLPWTSIVPAEGAATESADAYVRPGFASAVRGIRLGPLVAAVLTFLAMVYGTAVRWRRLAVVQDVTLSWWEAVRLTWMGAFFNYVIPGTTGGDVLKAWYASRHAPHHKMGSLVSVVTDRALGLTSLALLSAAMLAGVAVAGAWFGLEVGYTGRLGRIAVGLAVLLGVLAVVATVVFSRRVREGLHLERLYNHLPLAAHLRSADAALDRVRGAPGAVAGAMAVSIGIHLMLVTSVALLGMSLGAGIPWYQYAICVPLIYIIAAVPIVPGGVGLAEGFYVAFFGAWTVESRILAMALLARLIPMLLSLPGVLVAVGGPAHPSAARMKAELEADEAA